MTYHKQPAEEVRLAVNFDKLLGVGETSQVGSDVKVYDDQGQDVTSTLLKTKTVGARRIDAIIKAGTNGKVYKVMFTMITQNERYDEPWEVVVRTL